MCDFCGCPTIPPFDRLTDDHLTLAAVADAYAATGDERDLDALRITWADHLAMERAAVAYLARELDLEEVVETGRELDARVGSALATGDARELVRALADHVEGYEFEIYPPLVLQAADEDLLEAERCAEGAEAAA